MEITEAGEEGASRQILPASAIGACTADRPRPAALGTANRMDRRKLFWLLMGTNSLR